MTTKQDERAELPPLPEADGYAVMTPQGSIIVPPSEYQKHNAYAVFTADQMREYARAALIEADVNDGDIYGWAKVPNQSGMAVFDPPFLQGPLKPGSVYSAEYVAVYTRPQQAAQVPLTDEQIELMRGDRGESSYMWRCAYEVGIRDAEAAHQIGKAVRTCGACGMPDCVAWECSTVGIGKDQA